MVNLPNLLSNFGVADTQDKGRYRIDAIKIPQGTSVVDIGGELVRHDLIFGRLGPLVQDHGPGHLQRSLLGAQNGEIGIGLQRPHERARTAFWEAEDNSLRLTHRTRPCASSAKHTLRVQFIIVLSLVLGMNNHACAKGHKPQTQGEATTRKLQLYDNLTKYKKI